MHIHTYTLIHTYTFSALSFSCSCCLTLSVFVFVSLFLSFSLSLCLSLSLSLAVSHCLSVSLFPSPPSLPLSIFLAVSLDLSIAVSVSYLSCSLSFLFSLTLSLSLFFLLSLVYARLFPHSICFSLTCSLSLFLSCFFESSCERFLFPSLLVALALSIGLCRICGHTLSLSRTISLSLPPLPWVVSLSRACAHTLHLAVAGVLAVYLVRSLSCAPYLKPVRSLSLACLQWRVRGHTLCHSITRLLSFFPLPHSFFLSHSIHRFFCLALFLLH